MQPDISGITFWQYVCSHCVPDDRRGRDVRVKKRKGKDEYLYSAFIQCIVSKRSDMNHTVLPANYTMPAFPS